MKTVWKNSIPVDDHPHEVVLPKNHELVHVQCQWYSTSVEVWSVVMGGPNIYRYFQVYGTGQSVPDEAIYIGTAITGDGHLVWHLFDVSERKDSD